MNMQELGDYHSLLWVQRIVSDAVQMDRTEADLAVMVASSYSEFVEVRQEEKNVIVEADVVIVVVAAAEQ